ncbi:hypothetical protein Rmet_3845 (plasmid) [Cupriavidus metallidurans CH34]|uniref:Uncharacterized protein n=1 Tax=Cupriavidus metallidurans (strain ATCC 43123 / DSM 2839 / NBRC 102507 / CH34) TaxID=266264 RepID=Q1LGL3_CUPMC|nr:hypothetical protein Rmet_3845 [Cupriavidus metallidurans CH34]
MQVRLPDGFAGVRRGSERACFLRRGEPPRFAGRPVVVQGRDEPAAIERTTDDDASDHGHVPEMLNVRVSISSAVRRIERVAGWVDGWGQWVGRRGRGAELRADQALALNTCA